MKNQIVLLLGFLAIIGCAQALRCYSCEGLDKDGVCGDPFGDAPIVDCPVDATGCKKGELNLENLGWGVERICDYSGIQDRCDREELGTNIFSCYCQEDLCNGATPARVSIFTVGLALLALITQYST